MSRKRNHRMRPEQRALMQRGLLQAVTPDRLAALNQLHTEEEVTRVMNLLRASLVRFLEGTAERADLIRLAGEFNTCYIAAGEIEGGELVQERLAAAGAALEESQRIHAAHGRYGLTGPGRILLGEGVDALELVLRATSPRQMHDAEQALHRTLQAQRRQSKEGAHA